VDTDSLLAFVRFHAWANRRIIETAAELTDDELRRAGPLDHGTAFQTVRHLVDVDWSWREFCTGNDVGETYVWEKFPLEDLASLGEFSGSEDARLLAFVGSLDDAHPLRRGDGPEVADHRARRQSRDPAPQRARSLPHRPRSLAGRARPARRLRALETVASGGAAPSHPNRFDGRR
jgi:uncharacterized damage-inducible protein DinB